MLTHKLNVATIVLAGILLSACGSNDISTTPGNGAPPTPTPSSSPTPSPTATATATPDSRLQGFAVDDPIAGLAYLTESEQGVTDAHGGYFYRTGENISFSLCAFTLGPVAASHVTVASQMLGIPLEADIDEHPAAINLARLLQTLDSDLDPTNGIRIPDQLRSTTCDAIDFEQSVADFAQDPAVLALLQHVGRTQLVNATRARNRLQHTIDFVRTHDRANVMPIANAGNDQTVMEGSTFTLSSLGSSDPDGLLIAYAWTEVSSTGLTFAHDNSSATQVVAPNVVSDQVATVNLKVTDLFGATANDTVRITIIAGNDPNIPPSVSAGPDQSVNEGQFVQLNGQASDADGSIATIQWTTVGHAVALDDAGTLTPSFQAPQVDIDTDFRFRLSVTDDLGSTRSDDVVIRVKDVIPNIPPSAYAGDDQEVDEATQVQLDGRASTDADGTIVAFEWVNISGIPFTIDGPATSQPSFTAPQVDSDTQISIRLTVTDDQGAQDSDEVTILVRDVIANQLPQADAGADQSVDIGTTVTLDGSNSTDADGTIDSYQWMQTGGDPITLSDATTATASFVAPMVSQQTTLTFELTVTDNDGAADSDTVQITIQPDPLDPNRAPTARIALSSNPAFAGDTVTLNASASSDPDGDVLSYQWSEDTGSDCGLSFADDSAVVTTVTAPEDGSTSCPIRLTVSDPDGMQDSTSTTLYVIPDFGDLIPFEDCISNITDFDACVAACDELLGNACSMIDLAELCQADIIGVAPPEFCPLVDEDGDGVDDRRDLCPGTDPGVPVDPLGCADEQNSPLDVADQINDFLSSLCDDFDSPEGLQQCLVDGLDEACDALDPEGLTPLCSDQPIPDPTELIELLCQGESDIAACLENSFDAVCAAFDPDGQTPVCGQLRGDGFTAQISFGSSQTDPGRSGVIVLPDANGNIVVTVTAYVFDSTAQQYQPVPDGHTLGLGLFYAQLSADPIGGLPQAQLQTVSNGRAVFTINASDIPSALEGNSYIFQAYYYGASLQESTRQSSHFLPKELLLAAADQNTIGLADVLDDNRSPSDDFDGHPFTPVFIAALPETLVQGDGFTARIRFGRSELDPNSNALVVLPDNNGEITVRVTPYLFDEGSQTYLPVPDGQRIDMGVFYARATTEPIGRVAQQQGSVSNSEVVFTFLTSELPSLLDGNGYIFQAYYFGEPAGSLPTRQSNHFLPKELLLSAPEPNIIGAADALDDNRSPTDAFDGHPYTPVFIAAVPESLLQGDGFTARIAFGSTLSDPSGNGLVVVPDDNGEITVRVTPYVFDSTTRRYALVADGERIDLGVFHGRLGADPVDGLPQQDSTVINGQATFTYDAADLPGALDGNGYIFQAYYFGNPAGSQATRQSSHFLPKELILQLPDQNAVGLADAMDDNLSPSDALDGHPFTPVFIAALPTSLVQGDGFTARIQFGQSEIDPSSNGVVIIPDANGEISVAITPYIYDESADTYQPVPDGQRVDLGVFYARLNADPVAGLPQEQGVVNNGQVRFTYNVNDLPGLLDGNGYIFQAYYFGASEQEPTRQSSHFLPKELVLGIPDQNALGLADAMDDNRSPSDAVDGHPYTPVFIAAPPGILVQGDGFTARIEFAGNQLVPGANGVVVVPDSNGDVHIRVTPYIFDPATQNYIRVPETHRIDLGVFHGQLDPADPVGGVTKKIGAVTGGQVVFTYNVDELPSSIEGNGYIFQAYYFGPIAGQSTRQSSHFLPKDLTLVAPDQTTLGLADALDDNRSPSDAVDGHPFTPVFVVAPPNRSLVQGDGFTARIQFGNGADLLQGSGVVVVPDGNGNITVRVTPYIFNDTTQRYARIPDGHLIGLGMFYAQPDTDPVGGLPQTQTTTVSNGIATFTISAADIPSSLDGNAYIFQAYYYGMPPVSPTRQSSHLLAKELLLTSDDQNLIGLADALDDNLSPDESVDGHPFTPVLVIKLF